MTTERSLEPEGFIDNFSRQPNRQALLERCQATANRLLEIVSEESRVLRKFKPDELLAILPTKQMLVRELEVDLRTLCGADIDRWKMEMNAEAIPLRYTLAEIEKVNSSNQVFVQGSLDFWEGFLSAVHPASYGPGHESMSSGPRYLKGRSFNREV